MNASSASPRELFERAVSLFNQGRLEAAEEICAQLLPALPANAELAHFGGVVANRMGRFDLAAERLAQSVRLDPGRSRAHAALGYSQERLDRLEEARRSLQAAIGIEPAFAEAHNSLGIVEHRLGRFEEALRAFERALAFNPALAQARLNAARALFALAAADVESGNPAVAVERLRSALAIDPAFHEAHAVLGTELLASGQLAQGWREYVHRPTRGAGVLAEIASGSYPPALPRGFAGRDVVLRGEQGLGDGLFFMRYAAPLAAGGARLHARIDRRLAPLIARALPIATFDADAPEEAISLWIGDLPVFVAPLGEDPARSLAIEPLPERVARMLERLPRGNRPRIGLAWRAGTPAPAVLPGQRVLAKEVPVDALAAALAGVEADFVIVQRDPGGGELAALEKALGRSVIDLSAANSDLEDMLALMSVLDEYVGVSSTNVHLRAAAGGAGRILVPHPAEWRWQRSGESSPWFPGFKVYRESPGVGWLAAFATLAKDLA